MKLCSALSGAFLLLGLTSARAATVKVGPGQANTTIQAGINAASNGDIVVVAPGTYFENIDFLGKAITVTSSGGPAVTTIDGSNGQNPAVVFRNKEGRGSVLNGFTVQGGGLETYQPVSTNYGSGGILIENGTPVISNNIITHNHCNGIQSNGSSPLIEGNEIDNTLDALGQCGSAGGSAIWLFGSISYYNGGTSPGLQGAMVVGNTIQNNTQSGRDDSGGNGGAGVAVWGGDAIIVGNTIRNNLTLGDGGAILAFNTDQVTIIGNLLYGNQAATDGAMSLMPPDSSVGPFIGIIASNTIYGNLQTSSTGGLGDAPPTQVYLDANLGQYLLVNNIIVANGPNSVAVACGKIYDYLSQTPLVFDHNDLYNAQGAAYGGVCPDQTGSYGNIAQDPLFVNAAAGNFQLQRGSPAIDAGNNSAPQLPATDLAGDQRVVDGTGLGYPVVDMGAYEFSGSSDAAPTVLTLSPSAYYEPLALNVNVPPIVFTVTLASAAGTPTGPVSLFEDKTQFATVTVGASGAASYTAAGLTPGTHAFVATYAGQGVFPPAVSVKFYLYVPPYGTQLTLTSSPNPSTLNSPVTFSVQSSSADGSTPGPIVLTDLSTNTVLATLTPGASGAAAYTTSTLTLGSHLVSASFAGDTAHASASVEVVQVVGNGTPTTTTLNCAPNPTFLGSPATLTATVAASSGSPAGSFHFTDNGTALADVPVASGNGPVTYTYLAQTAGTHQLTAAFSSSSGYMGSSASCAEVVQLQPTGIVLSSSVNPSLAGQQVTFSAAVMYPGGANAPASGGSVTFSDGATVLATVPLQAGASGSGAYSGSVSTAGLATGKHSITATLIPAFGYASAVATLTQTVQGLATASVLSANPTTLSAGAPVTLSAAVSPAGASASLPPTGQVTFASGGTTLGSATLANGTATLTISTLPAGAYSLTCTYLGDALYAGSSCSPVQVTVTSPPASFTVSLQPSTLTLPDGATGSTLVSLASVQGFAGTLTLSHGQLPLYAGASLPPTVKLAAGATLSVPLTITTVQEAQNRQPSAPGERGRLVVFLAGLLVIPVGWASRRRPAKLLVLLCAASLLGAATGCVNLGFPARYVAAGSYVIPVTATDSQGNTQSANLNLVIAH